MIFLRFSNIFDKVEYNAIAIQFQHNNLFSALNNSIEGLRATTI